MGTSEEDRVRLAELNELAAGYCADGRYEAALPLFELVVAGCAAGLGADDPDTLVSHGNLVVTQLRLDPSGPALAGLDANVAARRRVLGDRHPATMAAGRAQSVAYRRAVAAIQRRLDEVTAALGPEHPDVAQLLVELAELLDRRPHPGAAPGPVVVPLPRQPRGARFPRPAPDAPGTDTREFGADPPGADPPGADPAGATRPRGARFLRGQD